MQLVIYRAVFGGYDEIAFKIPEKVSSNVRFVLITDSDVSLDGWEVLNLQVPDPLLANRHCKMFPWEYFDADRSLYIDGHIEFGDDFANLFNELCRAGDDFIALRHRQGGNVADELNRNIANSKISGQHIKNILLSDLNFSAPSVECGMLFRNHVAEKVKDHAARWWWYFNNVCPRDQLSVHTAADEAGLEVSVCKYTFSDFRYFKIVGHSGARLKMLRARLTKACRILITGLILE